MPSDLLVTDILSDANPFWIRNVSDLRVSWELSRIGLLSCNIPLRDLPIDPKTGTQVIPMDLERRWVEFNDPDLGPWKGVITPISVQNGLVTIEAQSLAAMMRGVLTPLASVLNVWGELRHAIEATFSQHGIHWFGIANDPAPAPNNDSYIAVNPQPGATFFAAGQDLYDQFIPACFNAMYEESAYKAKLRGLAWDVVKVTDPASPRFGQWIFVADYTYGEDKQAVARIVDRQNSIDSGFSDDIEDMYNHVKLIANYNYMANVYIGPGPATPHKGKCKKRNKKGQCTGGWTTYYTWDNPEYGWRSFTATSAERIGENEASIAKYGYRQIKISLSKTFDTEAAMITAAKNYASVLSRNEQAVVVETADRSMWRQFRTGDVITVSLGNSGYPRPGYYARMIAESRAYSASEDILMVSGASEEVSIT
jgi:hypothetical protein